MDQSLNRTKLYHWHVEHGARMVPFAGWEMPVQYPTGPLEEHHATRRSAGLFDIDHMGQIVVTGPEAETYLNHLVTWDVSLIDINQSHYALMCYEHGGVVDDVFVYKLAGRWFMVVNAVNLAKDYRWMLEHAAGYQVEVKDVSPETYMLALQGPQAIELLRHLTEADVATVPRFNALEAEINGVPTLIGRTGYTGEDGVELFFPADQALTLWESILTAGQTTGIEIKPVGLAARDSLRFEAGFALYGHEIDETITPLEANLGWICRFETDFIGKAALLQQKQNGLAKKLIGFEMIDKGVPRQDYPIVTGQGQAIGKVVTGMYAPTVDKYGGHAFVPPEYTAIGTRLLVLIRDKPKAATVIKRPFYTPVYRK